MKPQLSQAYVRSLFYFDPFKGVLIWRVQRRGRSKKGTIAGTSSIGGVTVGIDGSMYKVSWIIWLWVYGYWPKGPPYEVIDHINRDKFNNSLNNLRLVTIQENSRNQGPRDINRTGHIGIGIHKSTGKYRVRIKHNYESIHLGLYDTLEEAIEARRQAEIKYWGKQP